MRRLTSVFFACVVMAAACSGRKTTDTKPSSRPGSIVEASVDGFEQTLLSMRGKPVVVNFWATWCIPCRAEMPRLVRAAKLYRDDVRFLGVDVQDDGASAERFVRRFGMPFTSLGDTRRLIVQDQQLIGLPVTQFYRADGELAFVHQGEITWPELKEKIDELVLVGQPVGDTGG